MIRRGLFALFACAGALLTQGAAAIEYRSVSRPAIFYDAPSAQAVRLFVVKPGAPLEVLVRVNDWTKVRDAEGTIAWIENEALSMRRMVVVMAPQADIRRSANPVAPLVFQAEQWVALELLESGATGWVKVRHQDGMVGFVHISQVWGL